MKQILKLCIILAIGNPFYSCCYKKDCNNTFDDGEVLLVGFSISEIHNISVSSYVKNGLFDTQIDKAMVPADTSVSRVRSLFDVQIDNSTNYCTIWIPFNFTPEADYLVHFQDTNKEYFITDIVTASQKCNTCFLAEDNYMVLSSYKINGKEKQSSDIEIHKND